MITYSTLKMLRNIVRGNCKNQLCSRHCSFLPQAALKEPTQLPLPQEEPTIETKLLKIAIIGAPNAGKSTLINQIVERRVFPISKKVHTTRCRARAVHIEGNTQLVFLDTPGLVTATESKKYNLSKQFLSDGENAIDEADVVGVVHDLSNTYTRNKLDAKVLRLLHLYAHKESFLVLNKIDTLKSKRQLLDFSTTLTCGKLRNYREFQPEVKLSESSVSEIIKKKTCWENFSDVFMVSALLGKGTSDIKKYLLQAAHPGKWLFGRNVYTDQQPVRIIEEALRSKLLDHLPNEVPYNLDVELEYLDMEETGVMAVVLVHCNSPRLEKLVVGGGGHRIRMIAQETEQALMDTFFSNVQLRIMVKHRSDTDENSN